MASGGALQDLRVAGGVLGDAVRALWRDEFAPDGEWRTFCDYPLIEVDRLHGVLDDLIEAVNATRSLVNGVEASHWQHMTEQEEIRG